MRQVDDGRRREPIRNWGIAYLLFVGAVGMMYLESKATMTGLEHKLALLGIVVLFFITILVWLSVEERKWR